MFLPHSLTISGHLCNVMGSMIDDIFYFYHILDLAGLLSDYCYGTRRHDNVSILLLCDATDLLAHLALLLRIIVYMFCRRTLFYLWV